MTALAPCSKWLRGARGRSALATPVVYPGAYHDSTARLSGARFTGLADTVDGSGRAHIGTNAAARTDALMRVPEWLTR